ncbi:MAG: PDZ domain-containing protein [Puniceicoccaceae bacterium]|nr:MAG: PDZ domain-containing protein [Puniceicoccaceae bacterium]
MRGAAVLAAFALFWAGCQTTGSTTRPVARSTTFETLLDAVVRIDVREATFEGGSQRFETGVGSGVILTVDGLILTNAHVVSPRAVDIMITLANLERVGARLVGWDHWTDLALLQLNMDEVRRRGLRFAHGIFGDSDRLVPGQTVYAVGTPHGLTRTVTKGIISNNNRYFEDTNGVRGHETGSFNTWLQTDAAINPGNSGGPLVTEDGRIVGINSRGYLGADNLGFAIPANIAREVVSRLLQYGQIDRSTIGITPASLQDLESFFELGTQTGMLVNSVDPGSPASQAGIRPGDIILSIDGDRLDARFPEQIPPIQNRIANAPVGSRLVLQVRRGGNEFAATVTTEMLQSRIGEEWAFDAWGISVREVSRAFARENRLPRQEGVLVLGTRPAFPAEKAGLSRGDIITSVDQQRIESLDQLKEIYAAFEENPAPLLLETLRNRSVSFYVLRP